MKFSRKEGKGRKERKTAMKQEKGFDFWRMVFGCVFVALVTVFAWIMSDVFFAPLLKGYETVPCRIVKSSVEMEKVNRFIFTAEFAYEHNGRTCKSNSLRKPGRGEFEFSRLASRLPLLEKYAPGTEHECRVNPENPFDAVLAVENPVEDPDALSGNTGPIVAGMILALFLLAGVSMIASAFPSVRRLGTPRVKKLLVAVVLVLFGCPFMTVGSLSLVRHVRERSESKSYVPVSARVLYSDMYSFRSGGRHPHTSYSVRVGYEYTIDGKKYESDRLAISQISSNNYDHQRHLASRYKKGDAVTAYVSPDDPRKSLLEKSGGLGDIVAMAFMGLFGVVGFAMIVGGLWMMLSLLRGSNGAPISFERRMLKRSHANWVIPGLFTVVWNVFSWSFVLGFVGEEQVRRQEPALLVLAILFSLVGIFLIGSFVFEIVRELRAPRLVLTLSCAMWKHGSPAQVDWSLENPEEIESLEIAVARTRMKDSGKHRRLTTVSSQNRCRHAQSIVPGAGSFGFTVPVSTNDGCNLSFVAKVKMKSIRRAFTFAYPLPSPVV